MNSEALKCDCVWDGWGRIERGKRDDGKQECLDWNMCDTTLLKILRGVLHGVVCHTFIAFTRFPVDIIKNALISIKKNRCAPVADNEGVYVLQPKTKTTHVHIM